MNDFQHNHFFLRYFPCVSNTRNRQLDCDRDAVCLVAYRVYGCDHGKTTILCPRLVCQIRRSWVGHERCTAILIASMRILSVHIYRGYDEKNFIGELETVKIIMEKSPEDGFGVPVSSEKQCVRPQCPRLLAAHHRRRKRSEWTLRRQVPGCLRATADTPHRNQQPQPSSTN